MSPREYVSGVLKTESNNFRNNSLIGRLIDRLFNVVNRDTLSQRLSQTRNIRLLHATIGIMTEVGELYEMLQKSTLDLTNLKEEVGDSLWYAGLAVDELGIDFDKMIENAKLEQQAIQWSIDGLVSEQDKREMISTILASSTTSTCVLLDLLKKSAFYGKPLDQVKYSDNLASVITQMSFLLAIGGFSLDGAMEVNLEKLKKRYGSKFSESAALERNLAAERKILEK